MRRVVFTVFLMVTALGSGWLVGQQQQQPAQQTPAPLGGLFTGQDIGIRVNGQAPDGKLYGTLAVKLPTGEWVEVFMGRPGLVPLDSRR